MDASRTPTAGDAASPFAARCAFDNTSRHDEGQPVRWEASFADMDLGVLRVRGSTQLDATNAILELGVLPGERVALMMSNRPEFIWLHLGVLLIGAHPVPVNISQCGTTLEHILTDSDSTVVIDLRDAVLSVAPHLPELRQLGTAVACCWCS